MCSVSYKRSSSSSSSSFGFILFDVGDEVALPTSSMITTDSPSVNKSFLRNNNLTSFSSPKLCLRSVTMFFDAENNRSTKSFNSFTDVITELTIGRGLSKQQANRLFGLTGAVESFIIDTFVVTVFEAVSVVIRDIDVRANNSRLTKSNAKSFSCGTASKRLRRG
ncbi:unnamed protein product [Rotaria magnacalcarata]|uniref:Uncharacterized protein n=1 Tax=Rotaria magnacalcarata TaxID=392030 RepID=A0A816Y0M2_9BILA|nr:unnamed protein product [Rotaria magnacalcarata]